MRLYSRDDVFGALQLQSVVINHIQKGMRPAQPLHRSGQEAFPTPSVELERFSKSCTMDDFCPFKFLATPEPIVNTPEGSLSEDDSSSSDSSDSEDSESVKPPGKSKQKQMPNDIVDEFWYGITKLTVHAMIADPNPPPSITLIFQGVAVKTACGRPNQSASILPAPWLPKSLGPSLTWTAYEKQE